MKLLESYLVISSWWNRESMCRTLGRGSVVFGVDIRSILHAADMRYAHLPIWIREIIRSLGDLKPGPECLPSAWTSSSNHLSGTSLCQSSASTKDAPEQDREVGWLTGAASSHRLSSTCGRGQMVWMCYCGQGS